MAGAAAPRRPVPRRALSAKLRRMALLDPPLAPLDDRKIDLINVALSSADSQYEWYMTAIDGAKQKAEQAGDAAGAQALLFAGKLLYVHIEGLDRGEPDGISFVRTLGDPSAEELEAMKTLAQRVTLAPARARIADLVWQKARDHTVVEIAVKSYLEAGKPYETPQEWVSCTDRYSRALQLSAEAGKTRALFSDTLKYIEDALDRHGPSDDSFLSCQLMDAIFEYKRRDAAACAKYSAMVEAIARRFEKVGKHFNAIECWAIKERWENAAKNTAAARAARAEIAESLVREADGELLTEHPSYMRACMLVRQAVVILDKLQPESKARITELRQRLQEHDAKVQGEMGHHFHEVDVSGMVEEARRRVMGKPLHEALAFVSLSARFPDRKKLEQTVREAMKGFIQYLMPAYMSGPGGTVVAGRPGVSPGADPDENPVLVEMAKEAHLHMAISVLGSIEPARRAVALEHHVLERHFLNATWASAFVPRGREEVFARGLYFGMKGDFVTACHVLIPQIENAIRVILKENGVNTLLVNRSGYDEERDLGWLLADPKTEQLFTADVVFALRALLLHRFGPHLRNLLAHGTLEPGVLSDWPGVYLWWVAMVFCYAPLLAKRTPAAAPAGSAGGSSEVQ
jgi:hypothetical protein